MGVLDDMRVQKAVYWGNPVSDGRGGYTFDTAVELDVRWETVAEEFTDPAGDVKVSRAVVFPGQLLSIGGYLLLSELADLGSNQTDPTTIAGAWPIRQHERIPSADQGQTLYVAYL